MFQPYKGSRAFEYISEQIKQAILSKLFSNGDRLPSERDLAEQFRVGRVSIREALRTLETMGFIQVRKGSTGGAFICYSDPDTISSIIMDRLQLEGTTHDQMIEARIGLECAVIKSAIEHATEEDLAILEQDVKESKEISEPALAREIVAKMIKFHILVAEASHNLPYIMFVRSIMEWANRKLEGWIPSPEGQRYSYVSHKEMLETIVSRDVKLAQRLTCEHIEKMGVLISHREKE